jgi:hypothetical protein
MAERAGIFDPVDPTDYSMLSKSDFDWNSWIYQETRRRKVAHCANITRLILIPSRVACQIFCQDVGRSIFLKQAPLLLPLGFDVLLPSHSKAWEATTAAECLEHLQAESKPTRLSEIMSRVVQTSPNRVPVFQASPYGMFITIIGELHNVLFLLNLVIVTEFRHTFNALSIHTQ